MNPKLKAYLQLGRAQTFPADWLLVVVPFLHGNPSLLSFFILTLFMWFTHIISFGMNSLLDYTQGYDMKDESKSHHPLQQRRISVSSATNFILWGLSLLMVWGILFTLWVSPNPLWAVIGLFFWYVWGVAYNAGLSKVTILSSVPISVCFVFMGMWGWFLSHESLGVLGGLYSVYTLFTILFQISYSGNLKELGLREKCNVLVKLGAWLDVTWKGEKLFKPRYARLYGVLVKLLNLFFGAWLLHANFSYVGLVGYAFFSAVALYYLHELTKPRTYDRKKDLFNMSIMEICTIFIPLPILLPWWSALLLMLCSVLYFFSMNKVLWRAPYPKV